VMPCEEGEVVTVEGRAHLTGCAVEVPRDPSSAAFPLVAALIVPGSVVELPAILLNPRRTGLIETLLEMGADIRIHNRRSSGGEEIGDLTVHHSELRGVTVPAVRAPSMIDEYPVLSVAASFALGTTKMLGLEELRVKESDRLAAVAENLRRMGAEVEEFPDGLHVAGRQTLHGAEIDPYDDHRIAMAFAVAGLIAQGSTLIKNSGCVDISFPEFFSTLARAAD